MSVVGGCKRRKTEAGVVYWVVILSGSLRDPERKKGGEDGRLRHA